MSSPSFSAYDDHAESSQRAAEPSAGRTFKFVLPPLSAVKAQKTKKKVKLTYDEPVKKQPRPIKLKPLKEVLSKLISQIKKKDDYAFFLQPVDLSQVPGYSDVVAKPMDLGTMTNKVARGRYRSLEEFTSDLKLVTGNAKMFNPPGSIYYTEAERIEAYALDHIAKASATVIEYETDWNIDVEREDEDVTVDNDDTAAERIPGTPMDVDESRAGSPSVTQVGGGKRTKGKKVPGTMSESLEADGGLPGAKDGLGAFPPGSDWAELMLALKLKGKRYRTKKERIRIEKGGPPLAADGSLDYPEMEDPFTVLSAMVPDLPSRPDLTPLYPVPDSSDADQPPLSALTSLLPVRNTSEASASTQKSLRNIKPTKRRHWVVNRNAPSRSRAKDVLEDEAELPWKTPREPVATDYGTFPMLPGVLVEEKIVSDVTAQLGYEEKLFDAIRESIIQIQPPASSGTSSAGEKIEIDDDSYWEGRASEAETYIRDVVYGGADGLAYVRSVAEFLTPSEAVRYGELPAFGELGMPVARWVEENVIDPLTGGRHGVLRDAARILNSLPPTPPHSPSSLSTTLPSSALITSDAIRAQVDRSLHVYPAASRALAMLGAIHAGKIDLPALIRAPDELFRAEDVWAGRSYREKRRKEMDEALTRDPEKNAAAYLQWAIAEHREAEAGAAVGVAVSTPSAGSGAPSEDGGMLVYALQVAADEIARIGSGRGTEVKEDVDVDAAAAAKDVPDGDGDVVMKTEDEPEAVVSVPVSESAGASQDADVTAAADSDEGEEDPELKKLRLNLLALAKRAPLDQIMKLPAELVPAHLRHIVPTLEA